MVEVALSPFSVEPLPILGCPQAKGSPRQSERGGVGCGRPSPPPAQGVPGRVPIPPPADLLAQLPPLPGAPDASHHAQWNALESLQEGPVAARQSATGSKALGALRGLVTPRESSGERGSVLSMAHGAPRSSRGFMEPETEVMLPAVLSETAMWMERHKGPPPISTEPNFTTESWVSPTPILFPLNRILSHLLK